MEFAMNKKYCFFGSGKMGCEAILWLKDSLNTNLDDLSKMSVFMVEDEYYKESRLMGIEVIKRSSFNPKLFKVVIAIGDQKVRRRLVEELPEETEYFTIIHPSVFMSKDVKVGIGSIVSPGCILTYDVEIGVHSIINVGVSISHNCRIGEFFTASPKVCIAGNTQIGNNVFLGLNSCLRDEIRISNDVVIGMGSVVLSSVVAPGVYVSSSAKKLRLLNDAQI